MTSTNDKINSESAVSSDSVSSSGTNMSSASSTGVEVREEGWREFRYWLERAKQDLLHAIARELDITYRFFQYRIKNITSAGIRLNYNCRVELKDNAVIMVIVVDVPREVVDDLAFRYHRLYQKIARARRQDRWRARTYLRRAKEEEEEEEREISEEEIPDIEVELIERAKDFDSRQDMGEA